MPTPTTVPGQGTVPVIFYATAPTAAAADAEAARDAAIAARNAAQTAQAAAEASQVAAKTSETNAKTSETNSKTSETNANASKNAAASSATAAATSATNAGNSAAAASTSAINAATSETNSAASALAAQQARDETVVAVTSQVGWQNSVTISTADAQKSSYLRRILNGNVTAITLPSGTSFKAYTVTLEIQQGTGGSKTIVWPASIKWPSALPVVLSTTAGTIDIVNLFWNGSQWFGSLGLADVR